jgi:ribonuclease Z
MLDVALVGTGGMMPLPNRYLASMLCRVDGEMLLFDCGEGTQVSLHLLGWGFKNISTICFTHFHADHISGLPGLLLAIANAGRTEPIRFFGPAGLAHIVQSLCVIAPDLPFPVEFNEYNKHTDNRYYLREDLLLDALPVRHRAPCFAYSLTLKRRGRFDLERAKANNIPMKIWSALQKQNETNYVYEGKSYSSDMVLGAERKGLKLVYCTDTRPIKALVGFVQDADLFICEGLYGDPSKQDKAANHMHMTFREAAEIAKNGNASKLILTHFSPSMPEPREFIKTATAVFPNTVVGRDRMSVTLRFDEDDKDESR